VAGKCPQLALPRCRERDLTGGIFWTTLAWGVFRVAHDPSGCVDITNAPTSADTLKTLRADGQSGGVAAGDAQCIH
jgi:hypothetical protein